MVFGTIIAKTIVLCKAHLFTISRNLC